MSISFVRVSVLPIRIIGLLLGAFLIVGAVTTNQLVSDIRDRLPPDKLFIHIMVFSITALPLIVPWRFIRWPALWWPLFINLCFDAAAFLYKGVADTIWAFRYGESTQQLMFPILGFTFVSVVALQIYAVLLLRRRWPNHALPPTAAH